MALGGLACGLLWLAPQLRAQVQTPISGQAAFRELYRLRFDWHTALAFGAAVRGIRAARQLTPARVAQGWNTRSFDMVARTERWRIEHGQPTPQVGVEGQAGFSRADMARGSRAA